MLKVLATSEMDFPSLMSRQARFRCSSFIFFGPTETNSASFCFCATGPSALPNQIAFEFCYARENSHDHLAGMCSGVGPGLGNRLEAGTRVADCFHDLQEITGGARQSVELPDGYNVALAQLIEHPVEFRPVTVSPRDFLTKDSGAPGLFERFELNRQLLIFGGDASIAYFHHAVTKSFAKYMQWKHILRDTFAKQIWLIWSRSVLFAKLRSFATVFAYETRINPGRIDRPLDACAQ